MPLIQTDSQHYSDIADAIRDMSGNEAMFYPSEMAAGVRSIPQTIAIQPIIYSLEEREVGVWTDGKPLYQKTKIYTSGLTPSTSEQLLDNNIASNIDELFFVNSGSYVLLNTGRRFTNLAYYDGSNYQCNISVVGKNSYYVIKFGSDTISRIVLTYFYTKTTDTPGSGTWTPSGVPAHHYSTEEQVIGTWTNGKPLYEKTYDFTINDLNIDRGEINSSRITGEFKLPDLDAISYDQIWIEQSYLMDKKPIGVNSVISNSLIYAANGSYIRTNLQYTAYTFIFLDMTYSTQSFYTDRNNLHFIFVIHYTKTTD